MICENCQKLKEKIELQEKQISSLYTTLHRYAEELSQANDLNTIVDKLLRYAHPAGAMGIYELKCHRMPKNIVPSFNKIKENEPLQRIELETITVRFIEERLRK